jgi:AP-2 complex subunit beta-1
VLLHALLTQIFTQVQLSLLTATVKMFIHKSQSPSAKEIVHKVLKWATEDVDNPDLRDRGFMYWRLLAINPSTAREIVLAEKPAITTDADRMDRGALDQLLLHTGTLGSIYHKNPETFIRGVTGKSLQDSPALNAHSRAVLISTARHQQSSGPIAVAGPGPVEPSADTPAGPATHSDEQESNGHETSLLGANPDMSGDQEPDDDEGPLPPKLADASDPYSNLEGAFGNYLADQPKPVQNRSQGNDLDDLLL